MPLWASPREVIASRASRRTWNSCASCSRVAGCAAFRFRVARRFGYGASSEMTGRCFERLDAEGIPARLTLLHVLSDTHNVATQGPVWRVAGKAV